MSVNHSARSGGIIGIFFSIFFYMKVGCMVSLESPHQGDYNEYIQYTVFNIKKKITLSYPEPAAIGFFLETQERVRNSSGTVICYV